MTRLSPSTWTRWGRSPPSRTTGVPASPTPAHGPGALDPHAARLANRLVGNDEDEARARVRARWAVGQLPDAADDGRGHRRRVPGRRRGRTPAGSGSRCRCRPAPAIRLGTPARPGLRTYVAFGGGLRVPDVLGSRATDTLPSGSGPAPPSRATRSPLGPSYGSVSGGGGLARRAGRGDRPLRVPPGPARLGALPPVAEAPRRVDLRGRRGRHRVGLRLDGPRRSSGCGPTSCPARGWCSGRCRCRPTGSRWCSSPTTRRPAATRWSAVVDAGGPAPVRAAAARVTSSVAVHSGRPG